MKRLSLQWRITLMTVLLIGITCVAMNLLLCSSGVYYIVSIADSLQVVSTVIVNEDGAASFDPQLIAPNEELTIVVDGVQGLDAGANDYLAKPFHLAELEARIRSLTLRQFTQQDVLLSCGGLTFDTRSRTAAVNGQTLTLTRKETGILEYLMVHQGRPVSQEELMEHVWDNSVDSFSNSIRVHISALRKKLRAVLGYDPIRNRIGEGYLMGGEEG